MSYFDLFISMVSIGVLVIAIPYTIELILQFDSPLLFNTIGGKISIGVGTALIGGGLGFGVGHVVYRKKKGGSDDE